MFHQVTPSKPTAPKPATVYFLDWLDARVLQPEFLTRGRKLFDHITKIASPLGRLKQTPQSPPYHAEGDMVSDHVTRMLAGLAAFEHGVSLAEVEELVREKDYLLELQELEAVLKTQADFLSAYALCHDLGKADTVAFEALVGGRGEAEGFAMQSAQVAAELEKARYDKLRRAHAASGAKQTFFAHYGVVVHYPEHARTSASDEYASTREAVLGALGIPLSKAKLLTELTRCHMDVIQTFDKGPDPIKYASLAAIAERAGLNVPVFLDLLPATIFLDAVLGSLVQMNGGYGAKLVLLLNLFKSEREAMPDRHLAREQALKRERKTAVRNALKQAKLDADTVFELLKTPLGPVRGKVMTNIHDLIRDPARSCDFDEHTEELRSRARVAQKLLHEQDLPLP